MADRRCVSPTIDSLEADGVWCPMAHANRNDDSFQDLPPLRRVRTVQEITDPVVSPRALNNFGSYTGEMMAVCIYDSPIHPALVAYDYQDGSVRWTSPPEDLPGLPGVHRRIVPGILMAKMGFNGGNVQRYVFAANWAECVAYTADGDRYWKWSTTEISRAGAEWIGRPRSLRFNDAKELVAATSRGWIIKLNPMDGSTIDTYKMDTNVVVRGRVHRGTFANFKSMVVIGNVLYLMAEFKADPATPLHPMLSPVHLVRIELRQPGIRGQEYAIKPLTRPENPRDPTSDRVAIGVNRVGGSPSAWMTPEGKVLLFTNAEAFVNGQLKPVIAAVEDDHGVLRTRWRSVLNTIPGDAIYSAPALHGDSRTLLVTVRNSLYVFRDIDRLAGDVPSPFPLSGEELLPYGMGTGVARVGIGSPFALTFDSDTNEIVAYMNFQLFPVYGYRTYGFLGAFALPARGRGAPRPLWFCPLAVTATGNPAPGPGTWGQPALFRYDNGRTQATGLIVNTLFTGTYIIK